MLMNNLSAPGECLLCGRCLEVCPIFKVTGREELSPRGKGFLLRNYQQSGITAKQTIALAELCLGCRKCVEACPQDLNLAMEIARLKSVHPDWKSWIWSRILKSGMGALSSVKTAGTLIPQAYPLLKNSLKTRPPVPAMFKISGKKQNPETPAVIFPGCVGRYFRPELEEKALQMLKTLGYNVLETPKWACCGYPLGSAGLFQQEKNETLKNIELWDSIGRPLIFVFCATCLDGLCHPFAGHQDLKLWEPFTKRIRPLIKELTNLRFEFIEPAKNTYVAWHEPCHGTAESGNFLKDIFHSHNQQLIMLDKECCGMGGSFAIQNPGLSASIARELWTKANLPPGALVLTNCSGCLLQLNATSPEHTRAAHWLEILQSDQHLVRFG
ncbi:MAG: (Fe-S)-binding protein [Desulfonatronovibrio sp.]